LQVLELIRVLEDDELMSNSNLGLLEDPFSNPPTDVVSNDQAAAFSGGFHMFDRVSIVVVDLKGFQKKLLRGVNIGRQALKCA
jgi:hypothetical protein